MGGQRMDKRWTKGGHTTTTKGGQRVDNSLVVESYLCLEADLIISKCPFPSNAWITLNPVRANSFCCIPSVKANISVNEDNRSPS